MNRGGNNRCNWSRYNRRNFISQVEVADSNRIPFFQYDGCDSVAIHRGAIDRVEVEDFIRDAIFDQQGMMFGDIGVFDADDIISFTTNGDDRFLELDGGGTLDR